MITERLKSETAAHHQATENVSFGAQIMSGALTLEAYGVLIEKNYILHAIVEEALTRSGFIPEELELEKRLKTKSLEADLTLLDKPLPAIPTIEVTYTTKEAALGAMYVVEGATLGGAYILKALQRNPMIAPLEQFNYYGVYGDLIGPYWKNFQQTLLAHITTTEQEDVAIESAKKTFDLFTEIFVAEQV